MVGWSKRAVPANDRRHIHQENEMPKKSHSVVGNKPRVRTVGPSRSADSPPELGDPAPASRSASPNRDRDYRTLAGLHPDELLSIAEAATYLSVTERWIRRKVHEREFEIVRLGKLVRIRKGVLVGYENRVTEPAREEVA